MLSVKEWSGSSHSQVNALDNIMLCLPLRPAAGEHLLLAFIPALRTSILKLLKWETRRAILSEAACGPPFSERLAPADQQSLRSTP
jgi:hypothetical protein